MAGAVAQSWGHKTERPGCPWDGAVMQVPGQASKDQSCPSWPCLPAPHLGSHYWGLQRGSGQVRVSRLNLPGPWSQSLNAAALIW